MSEELVAQTLPWIAAACMLPALAAAVAAMLSRSLFTAALAIAAASACAAGALAALGRSDGALALALLGACVVPVLLLGGTVLSSRAARRGARGPAWLTVLAAAATLAAMLWVTPAIDPARTIAPASEGTGFALAALLFVSIAACAALLGYGERGLFAARRDRRE